MKNTHLLTKTLCKGRVFKIMKSYNIVASKEVVASFKMDYASYKAKFHCSNNLIAYIVEQHPELKE